jgi:hypothetical protein
MTIDALMMFIFPVGAFVLCFGMMYATSSSRSK